MSEPLMALIVVTTALLLPIAAAVAQFYFFCKLFVRQMEALNSLAGAAWDRQEKGQDLPETITSADGALSIRRRSDGTWTADVHGVPSTVEDVEGEMPSRAMDDQELDLE